MEPGSPLLALRLGGAAHALEPGRDYVIGSADDCDLRVEGAAARHCRLLVGPDGVRVVDLDTEAGTRHQGERIASKLLQAGDTFSFADQDATVIVDDGSALFVPIPSMRQAAVARRIEKVRVAAAALRHDDETLQERLAHELRRAPWLFLSLALHLLLLLLVWVMVPDGPPRGRGVARLSIDVAAGAPSGDASVAPPEVVVEPDEQEYMEDPEPPAPEDSEPAPVFEGPLPSAQDRPVENFTLAKRERTSSAGSGGNTVKDEGDIGTGSFRDTVAELQESGLEIVFVFDSTGSMTRTILDTKSTIVLMLDVLRALVPGARIGLVTYRDHGRNEEYLVRQVPLELDHWRASNFVQFVVAEGGGDTPEAVRAGLKKAFAQKWQRTARRVVVLAGDAPPHGDDYKELLKDVRKFVRGGRSYVHTLITTPDRAGDITRRTFAEIAEAGRGVCEPIENRDRVLQKVLTLAFGREYAQDLDQVIAHVQQERDRVDVQALHLVRTGGRALRDALRQRPIENTLWNALVRRPRRATAELLLDMLDEKRTPVHTRHACAAALQRLLDLPVPPIDPVHDEPPSPRRIKRLRQLAGQLPD